MLSEKLTEEVVSSGIDLQTNMGVSTSSVLILSLLSFILFCDHLVLLPLLLMLLAVVRGAKVAVAEDVAPTFSITGTATAFCCCIIAKDVVDAAAVAVGC